ADQGTEPGEVLASMLAKLDEQILQPVGQEDAANWTKQALARVKDWLGSGDGDCDLGDWRKTRLTRALSAAAQKVAEEWDQYLAKDLFNLMESPGGRVPAAETALEQVRQHCHKVADGLTEQRAPQAATIQEPWTALLARQTEFA